jgi:hypothetical protein
MSDFQHVFSERLGEIETYLDLLGSFEALTQKGPPKIAEIGATVTVTQQKILYSSVFLQLYNLVEATITRCVEAISSAVKGNNWQAGDLSPKIRKEWVRFIARTHLDLNIDKRFEAAMSLCEHVIAGSPITCFEIERGGGGNWDDKEIEAITKRLGVSFRIPRKKLSGVKRHFRNELGALEFIKVLRNDLAHGRLSFAECGEGITVEELRDLKDRTAGFLETVVSCFQSAINSKAYLKTPPCDAGGN